MMKIVCFDCWKCVVHYFTSKIFYE